MMDHEQLRHLKYTHGTSARCQFPNRARSSSFSILEVPNIGAATPLDGKLATNLSLVDNGIQCLALVSTLNTSQHTRFLITLYYALCFNCTSYMLFISRQILTFFSLRFPDCSKIIEHSSGGVLNLDYLTPGLPAMFDCIWIIRKPAKKNPDGILLRLTEIVFGQGTTYELCNQDNKLNM